MIFRIVFWVILAQVLCGEVVGVFAGKIGDRERDEIFFGDRERGVRAYWDVLDDEEEFAAQLRIWMNGAVGVVVLGVEWDRLREWDIEVVQCYGRWLSGDSFLVVIRAMDLNAMKMGVRVR